MQASRFECLSFDPFAPLENGFVTSEVDVRRRDVVQALVEALMVVVVDEGFDLRFEITGQEVVFEQDAVLQSLVPTLDLALGLGMVCTECPVDVTEADRVNYPACNQIYKPRTPPRVQLS